MLSSAPHSRAVALLGPALPPPNAHTSYGVCSPEPVPPRDQVVLVVDDQPTMRFVVERLIVAMGFTVVTAASGVEALALARAGVVFDFALLDVQMPGMTGFECLRGIRDLRPEVPALFMSGTVQSYPDAPPYGGWPALLMKPFDREALRSELTRALATAA